MERVNAICAPFDQIRLISSVTPLGGNQLACVVFGGVTSTISNCYIPKWRNTRVSHWRCRMTMCELVMDSHWISVSWSMRVTDWLTWLASNISVDLKDRPKKYSIVTNWLQAKVHECNQTLQKCFSDFFFKYSNSSFSEILLKLASAKWLFIQAMCSSYVLLISWWYLAMDIPDNCVRRNKQL